MMQFNTPAVQPSMNALMRGPSRSAVMPPQLTGGISKSAVMQPIAGAVQPPGSIGQPAPGGAGTLPPPPSNMPSVSQVMPENNTPGGPGPLPPPPGNMPAIGQPAPGQANNPTSPFNPVPNVPSPPPQDMNTGSYYGGQKTVGASAGPADYAGVQGFADQAYQQARRSIDPMQQQQSRRMEQDLVNKGIDPGSPQGKAMLDQQNRNFADQDQSALFNALGFGQGIQNQMFGQSLANTQQAGNMQQASWQRDLAQSGQDLQRYGMDQSYGLGMGNLDMNRQNQDFMQMLGLEGVDFRNRQYNDGRSDYQDALTMALMGQTPIPGVSQINPGGIAQGMLNSGGGGLFAGLGG